ncbi:hypothetical protein L3Y34_019364 [Caenorhabditis briggsae]|uniref:Uncharacterized protein n=2 Tax=Caenorhabditis briggsae TaxID=6238 RepID=A0AAE9IWK9_CAEBR|nr:hypothetical protein L3Y34_019364 [Caenorhabditis briggsae]
MESQFGKVVPMTEEEQLKFVVDVANHAKGILPPPPAPEVDPINYVMILASQLPSDELKKVLWDSLSQNQKENWSQMFMNVKKRGEWLIAQNFARRAPSKNQRDRESRKRKRDAGN